MSGSSVESKNLRGISPVGSGPESARSNKAKPGDGPSFMNTLEAQIKNVDKDVPAKIQRAPATLKFSNHAVERMSQRGITFSPDQMTRIEGAARKAAEKGAKETLIFADDSALIVSLKNNTVVTVMDKAALKENVFTNIDATVVI